MLVEAAFAATILLALRRGKKGELTPERETAYLEAMENCRGPSAPKVLRATADVYSKYGCTLWATMLRKRADYLDASPEVQEKRKAHIAAAMQSWKPDAIDEVANGFELMTATGVARDLRARAKGIRDGSIKPETAKAAE